MSEQTNVPDYGSMFGSGSTPTLPSQIVSPYLDVDPSVFAKSQPVYIMPEGSKPTRGRFELGFGQIGMGVLGGFGFGAGKGFFTGLTDPSMKPLAYAAYRTQMLNYVVKHASAAARPCGTVMLFYAGTGALLSLARDGADDELNTLASGAVTGALFRSVKGPLKAAQGAGAGLALAAAFIALNPASRENFKAMFRSIQA